MTKSSWRQLGYFSVWIIIALFLLLAALLLALPSAATLAEDRYSVES